MASAGFVYEVEEFRFSSGVEYLFVSRGREALLKVVQYNYIQRLANRHLFNLGFGDFDLSTNQLLDRDSTENGDAYFIFNTVLSTIPLFLNHHIHAMIMVQGSDSVLDFEEMCRKNCRRNCFGLCRKMHQRIRIYRSYLEKNWLALNKEYEFFGGDFLLSNTLLEKYVPGKEYKAVFIKKR